MTNDFLRYRGPLHRTEFDDGSANRFITAKRLPFLLSPKAFLLLLLTLSLIFLFVNERAKSLPTPLMIKDELLYKNAFISERAMNHVQNLTNLGPRPVGSFANEVLAINFFYKELDTIMRKADEIHRISFALQKASGSFPLNFLDGMTNVYRNIQNIVVKIGPPISSPHSILLNCHFDTVADSPGGSDDAASCAVMLEILRVISTMKTPLKNNIIFLFNGAEENLLQGSHAFITQHKWAKEVRAFINLEACGAGGKELLFQAGPENPWLIEAYGRHVKSPMASTIAEEVFQSGLIPGETDFRIFRDFGKIPGLDFAWTANGYVYHTKNDNPNFIPLGSLQHTGDNVLPLTIELANLPFGKEYFEKEGNLVYFDFFGIMLVRIRESTSALINIIVVCLAVFTMYSNCHEYDDKQGLRKRTYMKQLIFSCCFLLISWIASITICAALAFIFTYINRAMSWYANPVWMFFLYSLPSVLISLWIITSAGNWQSKRMMLSSVVTLQKLHSDALNLILAFTLLCTIIFNIRSGFIVCLSLFFLILGNTLKDISLQKGGPWFWTYVLTLLYPFINGAYNITAVIRIIIPMLGRSGSGNHSEVIVAIISSVMTLLLISFILPYSVLLISPKKVIKPLLYIIAGSFLALIFTPLGFPYSANSYSPTPQRYMILHVVSESRDLNGFMLTEKSGFWVVDLDVNSPHLVESFVPELSAAEHISECSTQLYCGLPYLLPVKNLIWQTHWIPAPKPNIFIPTELKLTKKLNTSSTNINFLFSASGPDHMILIISPLQGVKISSTSLLESGLVLGPKWKERNRDTYFVYYSCASNPVPWKFSIEIQVSEHFKGSYFMDIALSGHFLHGANQRSVKLTKLLAQFPPWAVTTGWTAAHINYKF